MAKLREPYNQNIVSTPYFGSTFEFESAPDAVRLCRYLNQMLNIFGKDVVLQGGTVSSVTNVGNNFNVSFRSGRIIQDQTLIRFNAFSLDMDVTTFTPSTTTMLVCTKFKYLEADRDVETDPSPFIFRLLALDRTTGIFYTESANNSIITYSWDTNYNRIVLSAFNLDDLINPLDQITIGATTYITRGDFSSVINPMNYDGGVI